MANGWTALRRPLLIAIVIGCSVSLMTSGRVTLRLAGPAALEWSFIPLLEFLSLAAVYRGRPPARTIDLFFAGHAPWLLWTIAFAALFAFVPAPVVFAGTGFPWVWYGLAAVAAARSAYLDFSFSRRTLGRTDKQAMRDVAIERLIVWPAGIAIFVAPAALQRLGI